MRFLQFLVIALGVWTGAVGVWATALAVWVAPLSTEEKRELRDILNDISEPLRPD